MKYQSSLCSGCGNPKHESFDPVTEDAYDVQVLQCHACAASQRVGWNRNADRDEGAPPGFGEYFSVTGPHPEDMQRTRERQA